MTDGITFSSGGLCERTLREELIHFVNVKHPRPEREVKQEFYKHIYVQKITCSTDLTVSAESGRKSNVQVVV